MTGAQSNYLTNPLFFSVPHCLLHRVMCTDQSPDNESEVPWYGAVSDEERAIRLSSHPVFCFLSVNTTTSNWHHNNLELILYFPNLVWIQMQRQCWGNWDWEMGWRAYMGFSECTDTILNWAHMGFSECPDTIFNWTEPNSAQYSHSWTKLLCHFLVFCLVEQVTIPLFHLRKSLCHLRKSLCHLCKSLCHFCFVYHHSRMV